MRRPGLLRFAVPWSILLAFAAPALADFERESPPQRITPEELLQRATWTQEQVPLGPVQRPPEHAFGGPAWSFLGPQPILDDYWANFANVSGRVSSIAVHPTNGSIAYVAAAQGGVWKTIDGGTTWNPLTDHLSSLASGAVSLDPSNPNIVYYGTGELHYSGDSFYGDGLFRSTDAGATWSKIGTRTSVGTYIARVVLSPTDPQRIYVAGSSGIRRSTDGGNTWTTHRTGFMDDLVLHPTNLQVVYAAQNGIGIVRSTDGGTSWTQLSGGLPVGNIARIQIAIAPSNGNILYASYAADNGSLLGVYRTTDGGASWTLRPAPNYLGTQGWYDHFIVVHPTNPDLCIAGGVYPYGGGYAGVVKTTNGGTSWTDITAGVDGSTLHPDQHHAAFGPDGTLWVANDGGVWTSADLGQHWINRNATLGITQFYTVGLHPSDENALLGGTQDNGTVRYEGGAGWPEVIAGDGGPAVYEWDSPNIYYTTYVFLTNLYRWNGLSFDGAVTGPWAGASDRADWCNGPMVVDPNQANTLLVGTYRVFRSTTSGNSWSQISDDLTNGGVLRALALTPGSPGTIYSGSSDGIVNVTVDGGSLWNQRSTGLPIEEIVDIAVSPASGEWAYVIADRSFSTRIFMTNDAGETWTSATGDLESNRRAMSLAVDWRTTPPRLYVGTDYGVYVSRDAGGHWEPAAPGLPNCAVYDLAIDPVNDWLVAATHGRSMWRLRIDGTAPAVHVIAPDGGESWPRGHVRTITWDATDLAGVDSVTVLVSVDGGATYPLVAATAIANTGSFVWFVNAPASPACRVRVVAYDAFQNAGLDESDADFTITGPVAVGTTDPGDIALLPAFPNPGRAPITLGFTLSHATPMALEVFDLEGRRVRTLVRGVHEAGRHDLRWDARADDGGELGSGVYLVRLRSGGLERVRRVILLEGER